MVCERFSHTLSWYSRAGRRTLGRLKRRGRPVRPAFGEGNVLKALKGVSLGIEGMDGPTLIRFIACSSSWLSLERFKTGREIDSSTAFVVMQQSNWLKAYSYQDEKGEQSSQELWYLGSDICDGRV